MAAPQNSPPSPGISSATNVPATLLVNTTTMPSGFSAARASGSGSAHHASGTATANTPAGANGRLPEDTPTRHAVNRPYTSLIDLSGQMNLDTLGFGAQFPKEASLIGHASERRA